MALPVAQPSSDQHALRRANLSAVLYALRADGARSRARLATDLTLNKATVSSLVTELRERRLVAEGDAERGSIGRPGTSIELDGRLVCGIGAEVNVNHIATLALNLRGEEIGERRLSIDATGTDPETVLGRLAELVEDTCAEIATHGAAPIGLGVGVAGLVHRETGMLVVAPNLGWRDVPVATVLRERLRQPMYPIEVHNEANLAVMAEAIAGDPERRDLLVIHGEVGIGGGIVADGRRFDGARGYAGEFGHMAVDPRGRRCACGRIGCWETVIGFSRMLSLAADPDDPLRAPGLSVEERIVEIDRRAGAGDPRVIAALDEVAEWLGRGAAILTNVLNPGLIVLGGYLGMLGTRLIDVMRRELAAGVIAPACGGTHVAVSTLGFATVRGGALAALEHVFTNPTLVPRIATSEVRP